METPSETDTVIPIGMDTVIPIGMDTEKNKKYFAFKPPSETDTVIPIGTDTVVNADILSKLYADEKVEMNKKEILNFIFKNINVEADYYSTAIITKNLDLAKMLWMDKHKVMMSHFQSCIKNKLYDMFEFFMTTISEERRKHLHKNKLILLGTSTDVEGVKVLEKHFPDLFNIPKGNLTLIYSFLFPTSDNNKDTYEIVKYVFEKIQILPEDVLINLEKIDDNCAKALSFLKEKGYKINEHELNILKKKFPAYFVSKDEPIIYTNDELNTVLKTFINNKGKDYENINKITGSMDKISYENAELIVKIGNVNLFENNLSKMELVNEKYVSRIYSRVDHFGTFSNADESILMKNTILNIIINENNMILFDVFITNKCIIKSTYQNADALFCCILKNRLDLFVKLIEIGYDINKIYKSDSYFDKHFMSPITVSISKKRYDIVEYILNHPTFDKSPNKNYANFYIAITQNDLEMINILIRHDIYIDPCIFWKKGSVIFGHIKEILEKLESIGNLEITELIFNLISDDVIKTVIRYIPEGKFTLPKEFTKYLVKNNKMEIIDIILEEKKGNFNIILEDWDLYKDIIFDILETNNTEMMTKILRSGLDINVRNRLKRTALIEAVREKKIEMVSIILRHNPDLKAVDYQKKDVYYYIKKNDDIRKLIDEYTNSQGNM